MRPTRISTATLMALSMAVAMVQSPAIETDYEVVPRKKKAGDTRRLRSAESSAERLSVRQQKLLRKAQKRLGSKPPPTELGEPGILEVRTFDVSTQEYIDGLACTTCGSFWSPERGKACLREGKVMTRVIHAPGQQEHMLCGMAFDAYESGDADEAIVEAAAGQRVTCLDCIEAIKYVRQNFTKKYAYRGIQV